MTFHVDDRFYGSDPVIRIPREQRAPAIGLWTLAGSWSKHFEKDGWVPDHVLLEFGTHDLAKALVKVKLWTRGRGGYQFVDWGRWQETREKAEARREATRQRVQRHRAKSADETGDGTPPVTGYVDGETPYPYPSPSPSPEPLDRSSSGGTSRPRAQAPEDGLGSPQAGDEDVDDPSIRTRLNLDRIAEVLTEHSGVSADRFQAADAGRHYLGRTETVPRQPTRFVVTCIRRDEPNIVANFIHTGRWSA